MGSFSKKDNNVGTGLVGAPACGDVMKLQIRVSGPKLLLSGVRHTHPCHSLESLHMFSQAVFDF